MSTSSSEDTLDNARSLMLSCWRQVWSPGGQISLQVARGDDRVYSGNVVIETDDGPYQFGAFAQPSGAGEQFFLRIDRGLEVGTTQSERFFRPPRRVVERFPAGLQMGAIIGTSPRAAQVLREQGSAFPWATGILFDFQSSQILFWADEVQPESLACTSSPDVIARVTGASDTQELRLLQLVSKETD